VTGSGTLVATPAAPLKRRAGVAPVQNWQHKYSLGGQTQSRKHEKRAHGLVEDGVSGRNMLPHCPPRAPLEKKGVPVGLSEHRPPPLPRCAKHRLPWRREALRSKHIHGALAPTGTAAVESATVAGPSTDKSRCPGLQPRVRRSSGSVRQRTTGAVGRAVSERGGRASWEGHPAWQRVTAMRALLRLDHAVPRQEPRQQRCPPGVRFPDANCQIYRLFQSYREMTDIFKANIVLCSHCERVFFGR